MEIIPDANNNRGDSNTSNQIEGSAEQVNDKADTSEKTGSEAYSTEPDKSYGKSYFKAMKTHLLYAETWLRILFIIFFALLYFLVRLVLAIIVVLQTLFVLFTGNKNKPIADFSTGFALYYYQVVRYLCYLQDDRPFPFQAWPKAEQDAVTDRSNK